ncbi:hypothetical protein [Prevotella fusca]
MIRMFWNDGVSNSGIAANDAIEASLDSVLDRFFDLSEDEDSFLGLEKPDDEVVQFAYLRDNIWLVDIPVPAEGGSYMKECEYRDCVDIIKRYYTDSWEIPSQFVLQKW